ncbi:GH20255 [Drosophila grimshawi]|uniref:GH20255 n=1 Tax=Drosophila grimshawi TaxID=7222 RepID=B4J5F5_DROGR|nr:GH20255 [Drosophila grimshawi]
MESAIVMEQEEEQEVQVSITFGELQFFDCDDISTCVPIQSALKICRSSLEDLSAKTVDVLSLWLRKLLRAYISEADCYIDIFKCLYEWFQRLKSDVTAESDGACSDFITLIADALSFAEWAKQKLLTAGERLVHTASFFLLGIVYSCLQLSNEQNVEALKQHEPLAIELHLIVLYLLKEITSTSNKIHPRITPLLRQLVDIADFLSVNMTHLHAFVKTGKTMTNICTHYAKCIDLSQDDGTTMPDWLEETVMHLCDTVLTHLETDTPSVPVDKIEEYLKVTQVYLIMLHKLLGCGVKHMDTDVLDDIVQVLSLGEIKRKHDLGQDLHQLIAKYVRPITLQIFELLYQLEDFQKYLIGWLSKREQVDVDCFELCLDYITATITDRAEISQPTCKTLQKIFEYLFKDACHFTNAARYNRILDAFGTLLHVTCSASLINYFCTGLFEEDIIKSQVCSDVLTLCFRLEEANHSWSKPDVVKATSYWIKCNNSYAMFSQNLSQLHIQRMLKYFHRLGNNEMPIFSMRSYRYLHCVSPRTEQQKRILLLRLQRLIKEPLSDIQQYYEFLALMELLPSAEIEGLPHLWSKVKEMMVGDKCKHLANTYFKLALQFSPATKLRILQTAEPFLSKPEANSCWYMQKFLHACKRNADPQLKSLAEQHAIDKDLLSLLDALQPVSVSKPSPNKLHNVNYKLSCRRQHMHQCNLTSLKRKRSHIEKKELMQQLEQNSQQLLQCSTELDASEIVQLRCIFERLKNILSQHEIPNK